MRKYNVGIVGATGMVGQRFVQILSEHPWFQISALAASGRSAGKTYAEALNGRWVMKTDIPNSVKDMVVLDAQRDIKKITEAVDFVFCAVNMDKSAIRELEEAYAKAECPVISNNSANRWTSDVPMIIPEINPQHLDIIEFQKKRLGTERGFIAVKSNCSIQSYVPAISALMDMKPVALKVCTYQAVSGAGKTLDNWPEMDDNIIPFIKGEEEKSEQEPMKVWGRIENGGFVNAVLPEISAQCVRVPVSDGHLAAVFAAFENKVSAEKIIESWRNYNPLANEQLPSAPKQFVNYFSEDDRPQTRLDRDIENGMGISVGRLRIDSPFNIRFVSLSHNTLRGAAGGAVLMAELLCSRGYIR